MVRRVKKSCQWQVFSQSGQELYLQSEVRAVGNAIDKKVVKIKLNTKLSMREWLSGRALPCQGKCREFESRLPLHYA